MKFNILNIDSFFEESSNVDNGKFAKEIAQFVIDLGSEEETCLFIQTIQRILVRHKSHQNTFAKCEQLLFFLENTYGQYIDQKQTISYYGKCQLVNHCRGYIQEARPIVYSSSSEELLNVLKPLFNFENNQGLTLTESLYIKEFWEHWLIDICVDRYSHHERSIIDYLITYNFNSLNFHNYLTGQIRIELQDEEDLYVQEQVLLSHLKRFNTIPVRKGAFYRMDFPNEKEMVLEWLKSEIKLCRKKQTVRNQFQTTLFTGQEKKIELNLSVPQIAYFFRVLNLEGIINNKAQTEILKIICENFSSKRTETISFESLHNKYYNSEEPTKESIRELFKRLARSID